DLWAGAWGAHAIVLSSVAWAAAAASWLHPGRSLWPNIGPARREIEASAAPKPGPASKVPRDLDSRVAAWQARHAAARVGTRPAEVKTGHWHAVGGIARHRPGAEQLVQGELPMENVAVDQPKAPLQVKRGQHLARDH